MLKNAILRFTIKLLCWSLRINFAHSSIHQWLNSIFVTSFMFILYWQTRCQNNMTFHLHSQVHLNNYFHAIINIFLTGNIVDRLIYLGVIGFCYIEFMLYNCVSKRSSKLQFTLDSYHMIASAIIKRPVICVRTCMQNCTLQNLHSFT